LTIVVVVARGRVAVALARAVGVMTTVAVAITGVGAGVSTSARNSVGEGVACATCGAAALRRLSVAPTIATLARSKTNASPKASMVPGDILPRFSR
jgi:hypothetical protein